MTDAAIILGVAVALDLALGDPPNAIHPVAWLGRLAASIVRIAPRTPPLGAFAFGVLLVAVVGSVAGLAAFGLERFAHDLPRLVRIALSALVLKTTFALRGLLDAARMLVRAHEREGLESARARLSWLCSRDASALDESGLANGTIESLAENLADSVVAPVFYFSLFGLPGAAIYRAVNTLDAMVGYRGEFEWLGKPAARLDDLLNLVPARITAVFVAIAGAARGAEIGAALRVYRRDRHRTESPNAGHPMAMASGVLGLRLDKPGVYVLGEGFPAPTLADVPRAIALVATAGILFLAVATLGVAYG